MKLKHIGKTVQAVIEFSEEDLKRLRNMDVPAPQAIGTYTVERLLALRSKFTGAALEELDDIIGEALIEEVNL